MRLGRAHRYNNSKFEFIRRIVHIAQKEMFLNMAIFRSALLSADELRECVEAFLGDAEIKSTKIPFGADVVIGVDVGSSFSRTCTIEDGIDSMNRAMEIMNFHLRQKDRDNPNILIEPAVNNIEWTNVCNFQELIHLGESVARSKIEEIKKIRDLPLRKKVVFWQRKMMAIVILNMFTPLEYILNQLNHGALDTQFLLGRLIARRFFDLLFLVVLSGTLLFITVHPLLKPLAACLPTEVDVTESGGLALQAKQRLVNLPGWWGPKF